MMLLYPCDDDHEEEDFETEWATVAYLALAFAFAGIMLGIVWGGLKLLSWR